MTEELTFESATIRRAPGFATDGFEVEDLSSDVNIIHGPNGAGKSTLARTMQSLLWPENAPDNTSAVGQFSTDDQWRAMLEQQRAEYQRDGAEANGPNLPSSEQVTRYHLALHDLLQHETRDASFAKQIERESRGGYDLDAAYEQLGFDDSPKTKGITEYKEVEKTTKKWRDTRKELEELKQEEARLPQLKSELEEAEAAEDRVDLLKLAIQYQQAQTALSEAEAELEEFPDVLEKVTGEEVEKVSKYTRDIEQAREDKEAAEAELEEAKRELEQVDLPEDGLSEGFISRSKTRETS